MRESWYVDLATSRVSYRTYQDSLTPPILHRKELMLPREHPRWAEFKSLTKTAEELGLFQEPTRIGFREHWLRLVREKGYQIAGHELIPIANDDIAEPSGESTANGAVAAPETGDRAAWFTMFALACFQSFRPHAGRTAPWLHRSWMARRLVARARRVAAA